MGRRGGSTTPTATSRRTSSGSISPSTTTATGHTLKANPFATIHVVGLNALALIEVSRPGGDFDHQFLPLPLLNERYWDGETALTTVEVPTRLAATAASTSA